MKKRFELKDSCVHTAADTLGPRWSAPARGWEEARAQIISAYIPQLITHDPDLQQEVGLRLLSVLSKRQYPDSDMWSFWWWYNRAQWVLGDIRRSSRQQKTCRLTDQILEEEGRRTCEDPVVDETIYNELLSVIPSEVKPITMGYSRTETAALVGIGRTTLWRRLSALAAILL